MPGGKVRARGGATLRSLPVSPPLAQVKAAVLAKVGSGATIVRIETDADGNGAYEAHLTTSDGTAETVYIDKSFSVLSVETR